MIKKANDPAMKKVLAYSAMNKSFEDAKFALKQIMDKSQEIIAISKAENDIVAAHNVKLVYYAAANAFGELNKVNNFIE